MSFSVPHRAYLLASALAGPLARPILNGRLKRGKEDKARLPERLGKASRPRPAGTVIWMHGASVGEAMSMLPMIHAILAARNDVHILVTTGTVASARRMQDVLPERAFHQFVPVDTRSAVRGFLDHWRPDLGVWVESELWPRLVTETATRGVPMAMVNARFSEKSIRGWRRAPGMLRNLLDGFRILRTQDRETLDRLTPVSSNAQFGGNLKALIQTPDCDSGDFEAIQQSTVERSVWLAASTHPDDELFVLAAQRRLVDQSNTAPLLVLAPRHPERRAEIIDAVEGLGLSVAVRSKGALPTSDTDVWLADTIGEMGLWYRLAPVTFVGGSFGAEGGHTPFEPILLDSAVLHGPNFANFAPIYHALTQANGTCCVHNSQDIATAVAELLNDPTRRADLVQTARSIHHQLKPDLDGLVQDLLRLLEPSK